MVVTKCFLFLSLILACTAAPKTSCGHTNLWGKPGYPIDSQATIIPPGVRDVKLVVPDGKTACGLYGFKYFVGEMVTVCDYDVSPTVRFKLHENYEDPSIVDVHRNGFIDHDATAVTTYHCSNYV